MTSVAASQGPRQFRRMARLSPARPIMRSAALCGVARSECRISKGLEIAALCIIPKGRSRGASRVASIGGALGRGIREFRSESSGDKPVDKTE